MRARHQTTAWEISPGNLGAVFSRAADLTSGPQSVKWDIQTCPTGLLQGLQK